MLYGGLNPVSIFYVYMGTATTVLLVSGFSILISVLARRPRDAMLAAYGLGAIWLLAPVRRRESRVIWAGRWLGAYGQRRCSCCQSDARLGRSRPSDSYNGLTSHLNSGLGGYLECVRVGVRRHGENPGDMAARSFLIAAIAGLRPLRGTAWPGGNRRTGWWTRLAGAVSPIRPIAGNRGAARATSCWPRADRPSCGEDPMLWKERFTR